MDERVEENANIDDIKVQALAGYICGLLKSHGLEDDNIEQAVTEDIINNYSTIMNDRNLLGFDCRNLRTVQIFLQKGYSIESDYLFVKIDETSMTSLNRWVGSKGEYNIIWMTQERAKKEYENIMGYIKERKDANYIVNPMIIDRNDVQIKKQELRRYIKEHGFEGIDTQIEALEVDHDMVNSITDFLMQEFEYDDAEKREKILTYLENNWSEILGENQDIKCSELHEAVFGETVFSSYKIYLTDGMALADNLANYKVIRATPEALIRTSEDIKKRTSEDGLSFYLISLRKANQAYANEHGIELKDDDLVNDEMKIKSEHVSSDSLSYARNRSLYYRDYLPNDIYYEDSFDSIIIEDDYKSGFTDEDLDFAPFEMDEVLAKLHGEKNVIEKKSDNVSGKKKEKGDNVILPEDLKKRGKQHMIGCQEMLKRLQEKIDSGEITYGHKTKSLVSLHRIFCDLKDKEFAARDLFLEYQKQLFKESRAER